MPSKWWWTTTIKALELWHLAEPNKGLNCLQCEILVCVLIRPGEVHPGCPVSLFSSPLLTKLNPFWELITCRPVPWRPTGGCAHRAREHLGNNTQSGRLHSLFVKSGIPTSDLRLRHMYNVCRVQTSRLKPLGALVFLVADLSQSWAKVSQLEIAPIWRTTTMSHVAHKCPLKKWHVVTLSLLIPNTNTACCCNLPLKWCMCHLSWILDHNCTGGVTPLWIPCERSH